MRLVLDANVLASALITPMGCSGKLFEYWRQEVFELVISAPVLAELERILHYPKIQHKYNLTDRVIEQGIRIAQLSTNQANPQLFRDLGRNPDRWESLPPLSNPIGEQDPKKKSDR